MDVGEVAPEAVSDPFASAGFAWAAIGDLDGKKLEKRFGPVAMRVWRHGREGRADGLRTWLLEKHAFRAAVSFLLPPGHGIVDVANESFPPRRSELAARAHERLLDASRFVPELPEAAPDGEFLVWSSPTFKPRGIAERTFCAAKRVRRERIPEAVAELWALPYRENVLERLPKSAQRLEVAIGITHLASGSQASAVRGLLPEVYESRDVGLPLPSFALPLDGVPPLHRDLLSSRATYYERHLESLCDGGNLGGLLARGRSSLPADDVSRALDAAKTELFRGVLADVLGAPRGDLGTGRLPLRAGAWISLAQAASSRALSLADVARRIERLCESVEERSRTLRELDLALLPDDGLRTTLEQHLVLLDAATALSAETHVAARLVCHAYARLAGVPLALVDAGLSVPLLGVLLAFEEVMVLVRLEYERLGIEPLAQLPFSVSRLLDPFVTRYPEFFELDPEGGVPGALLEAMRVALPEASNVLDLCRATRFSSEREMLSRESEGSRFSGALLSPLRLLARDLTIHAEQARLAEVRAVHFLTKTVDEADRRLARLETGLGAHPALQLSVRELIEVLDMRGTSLRAKTRWRRVEESDGNSGAGLATLREMPKVLLLPYVRSLEYSGRFSDSLGVVARALGREVIYREAR